ncbi:MAG: hypothetical protein ABIV39_10825, partial [Verrucomicrobiota bacterium]
MAARAVARNRNRQDESQLDFFSLNFTRRELTETTLEVVETPKRTNGEFTRDSPFPDAKAPDRSARTQRDEESVADHIHLPPAEEITPLAELEPIRNERNYRITDEDKVGHGSQKRKCVYNIAAIELLKFLEQNNCAATDVQKQTLVRYVGWGGLPQMFDARNEELEKEREQLAQLLTPEELESARATTLNAHYTSPVVIRAMYSALEHFGFTHGRILEPACGIGHFIGVMPEQMHQRSLITGIEIDSITARLAKLLYPDADIRHQPFEEARLADNFYDVAISNIPFGDYRPFDLRFKSWSFVIHDYFFAATLEKVRSGGLVLFITSKGTFDKVDGALREYVAQQADLLGAIRLPNDTFKRNANTEVTTDMVMLRKRLPGELPSGPAWKALGEITNSRGETMSVNEYFVAHPEMMLGEMRMEGRMYARGEPTLVSNGRDLSEQLAQAITLLPKDVFRQREVVASPSPTQKFPAPEDVKPNAYALVNGQLAIREGDMMRMLTGLPGPTAQRIRGLVRVRDAVRRCFRSQLADKDEDDVIVAREQLNQTYDNFVAKFGPISQSANAAAFRGDPDLALLLSLENYDE